MKSPIVVTLLALAVTPAVARAQLQEMRQTIFGMD
jgi:hypothetical protein